MNREFKPSSTLIRSIFAAAAVFAMLVAAGAIEGLVQHYNTSAQMTSAPPVAVAQR